MGTRTLHCARVLRSGSDVNLSRVCLRFQGDLEGPHRRCVCGGGSISVNTATHPPALSPHPPSCGSTCHGRSRAWLTQLSQSRRPGSPGRRQMVSSCNAPELVGSRKRGQTLQPSTPPRGTRFLLWVHSVKISEEGRERESAFFKFL